jgi:hypothetical protein
MLCGIGLFALSHQFDPPLTWRNPPIYPGAKQVKVRETDEQGFEFGVQIKRVVSFETTDGAMAVLSFYRKALLSDGWRLDDNTGPTELRFFRFVGTRVPQMYTLQVLPKQPGSPSVELRLGFDPGR